MVVHVDWNSAYLFLYMWFHSCNKKVGDDVLDDRGSAADSVVCSVSGS